ncbi:MAG: lantibiotic dehydratase [Lachnospiraceae bacterium]|nr:lantibiotic dehydratase [Lachnospiraceae bacterium]
MKEYFRDIGSFMIRTPSFPIDLLLNHIGQIDDMDSMMSLFGIPDYKQQFDEAILAASYDLYEAVKHYSKQDATTKDTEYLLNSLYKYFSRNCTRCTPFGLFSTVSFGEITGEKT